MKREKQKCLFVKYYCLFIYFFADFLITNHFVKGHTTYTNLLNNSFYVNRNSNHYYQNQGRSASLFSPISDNRYLQNYFKKVMEPIRNQTYDRKDIFQSNLNITDSPIQSRTNDMNTLPNYIYPSLYATTYRPEVIPQRLEQQEHLSHKKDSANSSKLKISSRSFISYFKPKIIPTIGRSESSFSSRSLRVMEDESDEGFQPVIPETKQSFEAMHTGNDESHRSKTEDITTIMQPSDQSSTRADWKNVSETKCSDTSLMSRSFYEEDKSTGRKGKLKKKYKKFMLPLLLAYKLKFFTLIPLMIGGLVLLTGATGMAGFFFALFASVVGLRMGSSSNG